jgi:RNA polymerase sigma factor (sigma-70 family)
MGLIKMMLPENKPFKALGLSCLPEEGVSLDENLDTQEINRIKNSESQNTNPCENLAELALQALICRIIKQDQSAFTALFKAMSVHVNSIALRITASAQLAEEVTEDTFFQVWRQAPRFDPSRGTAKAWILTIARSRALDARRSIPPFDGLTDDVVNSNWEYQGHDGLPDLLSAVEQNQLLHSALEALEPIPRQLIALSFFRGLSHEEIASHAELPLGTVKSHIRRAVIHLREALASTNLTSVTNQ